MDESLAFEVSTEVAIIISYLNEPNMFDDGQTCTSNFDFLLEQLSQSGSSETPPRETIQAVLDICDRGFVVTDELLAFIYRRLEPSDSLDSLVYQHVHVCDELYDEEEDIYTVGTNSLEWLRCIEATEALTLGKFSSEAVTSAISVALAPAPESALTDRRAKTPTPNPEACAQFAFAVLNDCVDSSERARPCRHAMQGRCLRPGCVFTHDLLCVPCRHWLRPAAVGADSSCTQGARCPFAHGEAATAPAAQRLYDLSKSRRDIEPCLDDFPSLPEKKTPTPASAFSGVTATATSEPLLSEHVLQKFVFRKINAAGKDSRPPIAPALATRKVPQVLDKVPDELSAWIEGGRGVAEQYATLRADAAPLARARNALFEQATAFYKAGKKAEARRASLEGQALHNQLLECQQAAAKAAFRARNDEGALRKGCIDLHTLHVAEAEDCLRSLLPELARAGLREAQVLTGSGHHSQAKGQGRLGAVVRSLAAEWQLPLQTVADANGHVGAYRLGLAALF